MYAHITLRIPQEVLTQVEALAKAQARSRNWTLTQLLKEAIAEKNNEQPDTIK